MRPETLERMLQSFVDGARAAWPDLGVDADAFRRFVEQRLPPPGPAWTEALARLPAADLYLACACAEGDTHAMAELERRHFAEVDVVCAVMRAPEGVVDEVKQILRTRFFVEGQGRAPAIAAFAGRGDLASWVRVSAAREVLRIFKRSRRSLPLEDALLDELARGADPERALVKQRCRAELAVALREALAEMAPRERTLLRYQIVDGLGVTAIGAIYRINRATAARRLAKLRDLLLAAIQRRLAERLALSADEVDSLIRMARSQLEVSVAAALATDAGP